MCWSLVVWVIFLCCDEVSLVRVVNTFGWQWVVWCSWVEGSLVVVLDRFVAMCAASELKLCWCCESFCGDEIIGGFVGVCNR